MWYTIPGMEGETTTTSGMIPEAGSGAEIPQVPAAAVEPKEEDPLWKEVRRLKHRLNRLRLKQLESRRSIPPSMSVSSSVDGAAVAQTAAPSFSQGIQRAGVADRILRPWRAKNG